jgi:hypothetical protein
MIITRHRTHKVNVGNYENIEFGASVTIDTEIDTAKGHDTIPYLNQWLDDLLQEDLDEAIANVPEGESTHAETWRR